MSNLKQIREENSISRMELAYKIGVTERYIYFLESGKRKPSIDLAFKIADILNSSVEDIFLPLYQQNVELSNK